VQGLNTVKRPKQNNNNPKKKKKKKLQPPPLHPNPARPNQRKETSMDQTSEKARRGRTAPPAPQSANPSQTNRTNNPGTNEPARTTEPVNNICISNDYETATQTEKEPETHKEHATTNKQTFLLANCKLNNKQGIQNETTTSKLTPKR
jgi:hypothetical protein